MTSKKTNGVVTKIEEDFSFASMRLSVDYEAQAGVSTELLEVAVQRPPKQQWFQVRDGDEWRYDAFVLDHEESRTCYLVHPRLALDLDTEVKRKRLYLTVTRGKVPFLWPVKLPDAGRELDSWNARAHTIAEQCVGKWIRVLPDMAVGTYQVRTADVDEEPVWPAMGMEELLELAFPMKRRILSLDHEVVRQLRGLK